MIDVILCCYNQEKTITQALESIYNQEINEEIISKGLSYMEGVAFSLQ